ncbi:Cuticle protein, partial [Armadillidium nasatum]
PFLFLIVTTAFAAPNSERDAKVLRDDRVHSEGGAYSFDIETDNGIKISEGGQPEGEAQAIHSAGEISYPLDNGDIFTLKYVANENGYQPESPYLPVAPAFPHPIPQFVLDQIAFAELQRAERERNLRS